MALEQALRVERHLAEWFAAHRVVPGTEVHEDPDITWVVQPGGVWGNAGVMARFTPESAGPRLDQLVRRYREHGRGMGLWISPAATPESLPERLRARRLLLRKRFPAMLRDLNDQGTARATPKGIEIRAVADIGEFRDVPHPSIGRASTELRRYALQSLSSMISARPERTRAYVAWQGGQPIASSLMFLSRECSGLHDLTVLESHRRQGIGAALLEHTCREAARLGATSMALIATSDGEKVYEQNGFVEVARFGYWYRSFQRGEQA